MGAHQEQSPANVSELEEERRRLSREIGERKARGEPTAGLVQRSRELSAAIKRLTPPRTVAAPARQAAPVAAWTAEVLSSAAQVVGLRDEWCELLARATPRSPFLTWEWVASWYETHEEAGDVRCLLVRDAAGHLVGLVPLFLSRRRDAKLGRRELGFASTYGHAWGSYLEPVYIPRAEHEVVQRLITYLHSVRDEWDCAKFLRMPAEAESAWPLVCAAGGHEWQVAVRPHPPLAVLALPAQTADVTDLLASAKLRRNCRAARRRLQRDYPQHRFRPWADLEELPGLLEAHVSLNIKGRTVRGLATNFGALPYRECFRRAAQRLAAVGRLRVACLEIEGQVAGTLFCVPQRRTLYLWSLAWDWRWGDYEVAHLLFLEALRAGREEGATAADFLMGEDRYKLRYTREARRVVDVVIWQKRLQMARSIGGELSGHAVARARDAVARRGRASAGEARARQ